MNCCQLLHIVKKIIKTAIVINLFAVFIPAIVVKAETVYEIKYDAVLRSASELDFPPLAVINKEKKADGFSVELLTAVVQTMGTDVTYYVDEWSKIKTALKEGEIDVLPLVGRTKERDEYLDFTAPYLVLYGAVVIQSSNTGIKSMDDLINSKIVVMEDDSADEYLKNKKIYTRITRVESYEIALKLLSSGLYDVVVMQELVATQLIEKLGLTNVKTADFKVKDFRQDFSFAVKEGDSILLSLLNEGLITVMGDGTYNRIYTKWLVKEKPLISPLMYYSLIAIIFILSATIIGFFYWQRTLKKQVIKRTKELAEVNEALKSENSERKHLTDVLKANEAELLKSTNELERFFHVSLGILCIAGFDGFFKKINKGFTEVLGFSEHELLSIPYTELIHPDDLEPTLKEVSEIKEGKTTLHFENRYRTKKGKYKLIEWNAFMAMDLELMYAVAKDITEDRQKDVKLNFAKEEAEQATKAKADFLASMSHEIRSPLNGIIGVTALLNSTLLTPQQKELAHIIGISGENLLMIINDILDFSKIEAGKLHLESKKVELVKCIEEAFFLFTNQASEKNIEINYQIDKDVPSYFKGDILRIKQVIINLISNAIKFTENGKISVSVKLKSKFEKNLELLFAVKDTGIGISKEWIDRIFESFTQGKEAVLHQSGGTGLGLSICDSLVSMMGGKIWVESEVGKGSTFFFTLKTQESENDKNAEDVRIISNSSKSKNIDLAKEIPLNILIVEDSQINQLVAIRICESFGYQPKLAINGVQALKMIKENEFNIIFMDIIMPEMGGVETTKKIIETYPAETRPKIIAMTANALIGAEEEYLSQGMDDYISKPVMPDQVKALLLKWGSPE